MVAQMDGDVRLSAYGSYISDMYTPDADIDLCIEGFVSIKCAFFRIILSENLRGMKSTTYKIGHFKNGLSDVDLAV